MWGATACAVLVASSSVAPSAGARAVSSPAMVLDAPGRFSTTTVCLSEGANLSASTRARMSVPPPGEAPTRMRIGLSGYVGSAPAGVAASAGASAAAASHATRARKKGFIGFVSSLCLATCCGPERTEHRPADPIEKSPHSIYFCA
jgi:hypothetical protein